MLLILIFVALVLYIRWLFISYQQIWKHIAKFPGPVAIPILGNILQIGLRPEEYLVATLRWCKEYKLESFRIYAGPQPYICILDPKSIEALLASTTLTYKADMYDYLRPWLGNGLLTSNDQTWVKHRKMITPSFHFKILQDFHSIINETVDRFINLLHEVAEKGEMFDFQELVARCTIDVICETAMGTRVYAIEGQHSPISQSINALCYVIPERILSVFKRIDWFFRLTKEYKMQQTALNELRKQFSKIIENRRNIIKNNNINNNNDSEAFKRPKMAFLDNLLTAEIDGRPLTFEEIFEEVSTFMFEGHDTTASAISFTIFCLSRHQEIQKIAFDEQLKIFGNNLSRSPTYNELQEMKYLELVIKESLRLFPSVPLIGRTMKEGCEFEGRFVPKGTTILLPIIGVGLSESIYKDPCKFDPMRFDVDNRKKANPFDYVPFSAGPRNCIGQKFAMMELKVTISKILRHFDILPAVDGLSSGIYDASVPKHMKHKYDPILVVLLTLKSFNGVYVRLKKRQY